MITLWRKCFKPTGNLNITTNPDIYNESPRIFEYKVPREIIQYSQSLITNTPMATTAFQARFI